MYTNFNLLAELDEIANKEFRMTNLYANQLEY